MTFFKEPHFRRNAWPPVQHVTRVLAWLAAIVFLLNALYFVLRVSNPVIQQDDWYFLEVFLRKAMDGSLGFADFFVKRRGADHAQPLFKLIMLFEWRYFDLDFVVEAVAGVIAVAAFAAILHRLAMEQRRNDGSDAARYLAWAAMCAIVFSLNGDAGTWTWPLVALENITMLIILVFMLAVWQAHRNGRYLLLALATVLLGISSDDSALIAAFAAILALLLVRLRTGRSGWKTPAVIVLCVVLVRIGYAHAPVVGGPPAMPFASDLGLLAERWREGGWWKWVVFPLVLPVFYTNSLPPGHAGLWLAMQIIAGVLLAVAHGWFWWKAWRSNVNQPVFVAICLMLLSYAWVAGIVLIRVPVYGNDYLAQPRYVLLYAGHLVALLLLWVGTLDSDPSVSARMRAIGNALPVAGCLVLLAVQLPLSLHAWHMRKYVWAYDARMAYEIDALARQPAPLARCKAVRPACGRPLEKRRQLALLLSGQRLNIYSPRVQRWHKYLPALSPVPAGAMPSTPGPAAAAAVGGVPRDDAARWASPVADARGSPSRRETR
ncbi:MAG: hypothetical protein ACYCZD_03435 [Rhodanobacter sp.]